MTNRTTTSNAKGYFLSAGDADELRRIGRLVGIDFDQWLDDRQQSSFRRRLERERELSNKIDEESESTYRHIRAVIENCKHQDAAAIRHQLVGLLPEVRTFDPDEAQKMRDAGLGHLVDRQEYLAQGNWSDFGYGDAPEGWEVNRI